SQGARGSQSRSPARNLPWRKIGLPALISLPPQRPAQSLQTPGMKYLYLSLGVLLCFVSLGRTADPPATGKLLEGLGVRALGPANMSGRVCDVAVVESKPATFYVASAAGGLWKTTNNGATWTTVFDGQPVASIGAVAVAPSD